MEKNRNSFSLSNQLNRSRRVESQNNTHTLKYKKILIISPAAPLQIFAQKVEAGRKGFY